MTLQNTLQQGLNKLITRAGTPFRVRYFTQTIGSVWDDEVTLAQSGNDLWTSGIELPISNKQGSDDSILFEQGKLIQNDIKLFTHGSLFLIGSEFQIKIIFGSPTATRNYTPIPEGMITPRASNTPIYRKVYLRRLTGSIIGE